MAQLDQLYTALRNADAAGDTAAAQQLAAAIEQQQGGAAPSLVTAQAVPPQAEGPLRLPALAGSQLARGAAEALGIPGDLEQALGIRNALALPAPFPSLKFPTSGELLSATAPLTARSDLMPQGELEQDVAGTARGVGATVPALLLGPEAGALALASGGSGGLVSAEAARAHPESTWGPAIAGAAGGFGVGGLTGVGMRGANALTGDLTDLGQAFRTAELPMRSPVLTSDNPLRFAAPFAPIEQTHGDLQRGAESLANLLGPQTTTPEEAGRYAQAQMRDWLATTLPAKEAAAWAPVDAAIPANTPTSLTNLEGTLQSLTTQGGGLAGVVSRLKPALPAQVYKALQNRLSTLSGGTDSWSDVRALRSAIGEAMSDPSIAPKAGQQTLKAMYSAITQDLADTAKANNASDLFSAANAESTRLHSFAENIGDQMVSGKTPSPQDDPRPEDVYNSFMNSAKLKRGASDIETLNTELPDVTRELAAAKLRQVANPERGTVGKSLASYWNTLSPEAQSALFPPAAQERLSALARIGQRLGEVPTLAQPAPGASNMTIGGLGAAGAALAAQGALHYFGKYNPSIVELLELAGGASTAGSIGGAIRNRAARAIANSSLLAPWAAGRPVGNAALLAAGGGALGASGNALAPGNP